MTAPEYLYRFRSMQRLLGDKELENQQIYFCAPDKLNDPIEGFKDITWLGDEIVWRNLLRHYTMCLLNAGILAFTPGDEYAADYIRNWVRATPDEIPDAGSRAMCEAAGASFLAEKAAQLFVKVMSEKSKPIRREELMLYLKLLHPFAMSAVIVELQKRGFRVVALSSTLGLDKARENAIKAIEGTVSLSSSGQSDEAQEVLFSIAVATNRQLDLIGEYQLEDRERVKHFSFFSRYFSSVYVDALDTLVHPNWYVACFSADPLNAMMWGTYGDGHRGACLKFRVKKLEPERLTLSIRSVVGESGIGSRVDKIWEFRPMEFRKVEYEAKYPPIDFFRSLGGIRFVQLIRFWYREGQTFSACRDGLGNNNEETRLRYWETFAASSCVKTTDWSLETEYRLINHSMMIDISSDEMRLLNFEFDDLAGIVFGARMSMEDKLVIMRIVDEKCQKAKRSDFQFQEVRYMPSLGTFKLFGLSLLKFQVS